MQSLNIGIMGTRGIPNAYGGFEQFASQLSVRLVNKGHEVAVYNSSLHPYRENEWQGVKIIHCRVGKWCGTVRNIMGQLLIFMPEVFFYGRRIGN